MSKKLGILFTSFLLLLTGGLFLVYQSRSIPDLDEQNQVTVLPKEFRYILGTKTFPGAPNEEQVKIPIFLYHYVEYVKNDPGRQKLNVPPNILVSQIETLKNAGYTFVTPNDLVDEIAGKLKLPKKLAMLSFDDGYMDFYTDVFPILKEEKVKAVAYIVPNFLDRPNYMFTFQLQEIAKSPFVEIGAHTMDHLWLKGVAKQTAEFEIAKSRIVLQDMLHLPINSFAYPYGAFDMQAVDIAMAAGFTNAVSTVPGIIQTQQNKYFFNRLRPGYRTGQTLLSFLSQDKFQPW